MSREAGNLLLAQEEKYRFSDEVNGLSRLIEPGSALIFGIWLSRSAIHEVTNIDELRAGNYRSRILLGYPWLGINAWNASPRI